ncbi:MAG: hypothetical protein R3C03_21645 [Pirellulaceae bacterium]
MNQTTEKIDDWFEWVQDAFGRWIIVVIAIVCAILSVGTFFNLDLFSLVRPGNLDDQQVAQWNLSTQITILLGLVALLATYFCTALTSRLRNISKQQEKFETDIKNVNQTLGLKLEEQLDEINSKLDPSLSKIIGNYASDLAAALCKAIKERSVVIRDVNEFRVFYKRALSAFPQSDIFATSLASRDYFWSDSTINDSITEFIQGGGKMTRVFFLDGSDALSDEETREILNAQRRAGVEVLVANQNKIPEDLKRLFVVDLKQPIAWEVHTVPGGRRIRDITARVDTIHVSQFRDIHDRLKCNPSVIRYTPQLSEI